MRTIKIDISRTPPLISPKVYQRILGSRRLRQALVPEDPRRTPYEVLDYQGVLVLHDRKGMHATFGRTQKIRFLQDGVSALLDHMWGSGVMMADYHHSAGRISESLPDAGRRHLVINLRHKMRRGEELDFEVKRLAIASFLDSNCWLETAIDHPVKKAGQTIIFPKERPCQVAFLDLKDAKFELPVMALEDGRTLVRFELPDPGMEPVYLVRWLW